MRVAALLKQERGTAMVIIISLATLVAVLGVTLLDTVRSESTRSHHAVWREEAFHAAEAGLDDYIAKVLDDRVFYDHYVHPAEGTRRSSAGAEVSSTTSPTPWGLGRGWTYPYGKNKWRQSQLTNGYEYNLQITAPSSGAQGVQIVATGRKVRAGDNACLASECRVIEAVIKPSSLAEFQMLANADIQYGTAATTSGKIYAGIDSGGVRHGVGHAGTARAHIYAEGCIGRLVDTGSHTCSGTGPTLQNGAQMYPQATIRTVIKNPVNFASFLTSISDIRRAAQNGGVELDAAVAAWRLTFRADGKFTARRCTQNGVHVAAEEPTCPASTETVHDVPANGAVYSPQRVVVSGVVDGRVTVASARDIIVADNITYEQPREDSVLGLNAQNNVYVASYAPSNLTWWAATIAQTGEWRSYSCPSEGTGPKTTLTFYGSTATFSGGCMTLFRNRTYNYDEDLVWLLPPWFPTIEDVYTVQLFREQRPS